MIHVHLGVFVERCHLAEGVGQIGASVARLESEDFHSPDHARRPVHAHPRPRQSQNSWSVSVVASIISEAASSVCIVASVCVIACSYCVGERKGPAKSLLRLAAGPCGIPVACNGPSRMPSNCDSRRKELEVRIALTIRLLTSNF